eukprot:7120738-Pyramimonas_sp.AAC.1
MKRPRRWGNGSSRSGRGRGPAVAIAPQSARDAGAELLALMIRTPGADFYQYSLGPDHQSGKYQRHLSTKLPNAPHLIMVDTPVNLNRHPRRTIRPTPVAAVFETLDDEIHNDLTTVEMLDADPLDRRE